MAMQEPRQKEYRPNLKCDCNSQEKCSRKPVRLREKQGGKDQRDEIGLHISGTKREDEMGKHAGARYDNGARGYSQACSANRNDDGSARRGPGAEHPDETSPI